MPLDTPVNQRYIALDVMRGLTIALMILVNTPGSWQHVYWPLLHASWHGWTPTDLVFPFFLFIVGSSSYFSLSKYQTTASKSAILRIAKRTLIMFAIGLALNLYNYLLLDLPALRIMGVLQRIALCYFFASVATLYLSRRGIYILSLSLLASYWFLLWAIGGQAPYSFEGNGLAVVDKLVLGGQHMWSVQGSPFEPEGLLSTIPAIVNVLFGFEATRYLTQTPPSSKLIKRLITFALMLVGLAYFWASVLPINKNLWSSSYVLLTCGMALFVLAGLVWLIDIRKYHLLSYPWQFFGSNPLFIYCLSWLLPVIYLTITISTDSSTVTLYTYLWQLMQPTFSAEFASLIFAVIHVVFFAWIAHLLFKRRIFIKI